VPGMEEAVCGWGCVKWGTVLVVVLIGGVWVPEPGSGLLGLGLGLSARWGGKWESMGGVGGRWAREDMVNEFKKNGRPLNVGLHLAI
jgi:hypothetical protein